MALRSQSLFLYGFQVTALNSSIDFRAVALETPRLATLTQGYYSLSGLLTEIARAMTAVDTARVYTVTANRTVLSGTQNRVTITSTGSHLELLFGSGPRAASTAAFLIGFTATDKTGATTYTGSSSAGTPLIPDFVGYNYLGPAVMQKNFGSVNVSASGLKEAVIFQIQQFFQLDFRYEPDGPDNDPSNFKVSTQWEALNIWMIQQRPLDFTPEISKPSTFYQCTLETTEADGKGLAYKMSEMLPDFPNLYKTGTLKFRVKV